MLLVTPLLALALSTEIHLHLSQKEYDEGGLEGDEGGDDYQLRRSERCPVRGNSTLYSPQYKILPASGDFRDIRTSNWAYCAALCAMTTEPTRCAYWAWNWRNQRDPNDVGPPGTCILHTYQQQSGTHRAYFGLIHGSSRCRPGLPSFNNFQAICETYEPTYPIQCQRHADCAGTRHCISVPVNVTRSRVRCDVGIGDRCSRRDVCQNQPGVPVGCTVASCVSRIGRISRNPSGIIMEDCDPPEGTRAAIRRETAKCPYTEGLGYGECADLCSRRFGCEHFTWHTRPGPNEPSCITGGWCVPTTPPITRCYLHDSGKGYEPPPANLAPGERWITANYLCAGTPDAPQTVRPRFDLALGTRLPSEGTRLTPILGLGNKWRTLQ